MNELKKNLVHLMQNRSRLPEEGFIDLMSKILINYPYLGWELGSDAVKHDYDILSLTADSEHMEYIADELSLPIEGDTWCIVAGLPPRSWELFFELTTDSGNVYEVDGSTWCWKASWNKGYVDVVIFIDAQATYLDVMDEAINIILNGEIGELNVAKYLNNVSWESIPVDKTFNLEKMKNFKKEFLSKFLDCYFHETLSKTALE